jgi:hypothetical protein
MAAFGENHTKAAKQVSCFSRLVGNDRKWVDFCHSNDRRPVLDTGFGFSFSPAAK